MYQDIETVFKIITEHFREQKKQPESFEIDTLEKLMLKYYLLNESDVRSCPKKNCSYSGFIVEGYCAEAISCRKCGTEWTDAAHFSWFKRFATEIKQILSFKSQHFTYLRNLFLDEPCPKCGVMIQKNGGCEHMQCSRCKYEFCWLCLGPFFSYKHEKTGFVCPFRYFAV